MAPARVVVAALVLSACLAHGGEAAIATPKDGFHEPLAVNDAWAYYEFNNTHKLKLTSATPFNSSGGATDMGAAGSINTNMGEMFDSKGQRMGVFQLVRHAVGTIYDYPGLKGTRMNNYIVIAVFEFGTPEKGYFDDTIVAVISYLRFLSRQAGQETADFDAVISGGTGRFLGATGSVVVTPTKMDRSNLVVASSVSHFRFWVPRNLPTPKGPISGRRRSL